MLFSNLIQANLKTNMIGKKIEYYPKTESTNGDAWELIKSEEDVNGTIIITDNQYQGKGRSGHSWFMSPGKGIAISIILNDKSDGGCWQERRGEERRGGGTASRCF